MIYSFNIYILFYWKSALKVRVIPVTSYYKADYEERGINK